MIFKYMLHLEPYGLLASKRGSHKFCSLLSQILVLVELSKYLLSRFHVPGIVPRVEDAMGGVGWRTKCSLPSGASSLDRAGLDAQDLMR